MNEGYVNINGGRIWYQIFKNSGEDSHFPIIILHGGPGTPHNYLLNLSQLKDCRNVIFYDQLGCGKSYVQNGKTCGRLHALCRN